MGTGDHAQDALLLSPCRSQVGQSATQTCEVSACDTAHITWQLRMSLKQEKWIWLSGFKTTRTTTYQIKLTNEPLSLEYGLGVRHLSPKPGHLSSVSQTHIEAKERCNPSEPQSWKSNKKQEAAAFFYWWFPGPELRQPAGLCRPCCYLLGYFTGPILNDLRLQS